MYADDQSTGREVSAQSRDRGICFGDAKTSDRPSTCASPASEGARGASSYPSSVSKEQPLGICSPVAQQRWRGVEVCAKAYLSEEWTALCSSYP
eukprot:scaffold102713_cov32-Tisochrysis_lutea.AAC.2